MISPVHPEVARELQAARRKDLAQVLEGCRCPVPRARREQRRARVEEE
jgi:hypothetical protein